jgi:vitamin B12 transporter
MATRSSYALAAGALLQLFSLPSFAQLSDVPPVDQVVVTASRLDQQIADTIAHTTVITAADIRESQAVDLLSLLRREAGFEFSQTGGIGSSSSIFMRGADSTQVLVLVDGERIGSATTGTTAIESIMLDQVERVEIVRGNVSALHGAGAVGGVIQIFTKQGTGAPHADAQVMVGSRGTTKEAGSYGGAIGDTRFNLNASHFYTSGFSAINPGFAPGANPNNNPYENLSFSGQIAQRWAEGQEIGLRAYRSTGTISYDNAFGAPTDTNYADNGLSNVALFSNNQITPIWKSRLTLAESMDRSKNYTNDESQSQFDTHNLQVSWQNDITVAKDQIVTAGLEHQLQRVISSTAYDSTGRNVNSAFLSYNGRFGNNQFQLGARHDGYSDFGDANTGLAGYGYNLNPNWKLTAMYSSAFSAPNFNDLFYPGFSNPNLQPERSVSTELGLQYAANDQLMRLAVFRTLYRDLIESPAPVYLPVNVDRAQIQGAEISYTGRIGDWDLRASFTAENPVDSTIGQQLPRRAKAFGNLVLGTKIGGWRIGGELRQSGPRPDSDIVSGAPVTLASYTVVDLVARYAISKSISLSARAENVFNEKYQLAEGYNTPGPGVFVTLEWRQQ